MVLPCRGIGTVCLWKYIVILFVMFYTSLGKVHTECVEECLPDFLHKCEDHILAFNKSLKDHDKDLVCRRLQDVIKCIGAYSRICVENATIIFETYTSEPYNCQLITREIIEMVQNNSPDDNCIEGGYDVTGNTNTDKGTDADGAKGDTNKSPTPRSAEQNNLENETSNANVLHSDTGYTYLLTVAFLAAAKSQTCP